MSYNAKTAARPWIVTGNDVRFRAASIGQEFVAEVTPEISEWAYDLIGNSPTWRAADIAT